MKYPKLSKDVSLVNLANSILKYMDCETFHPSIKEIDEVLKKSGKKKICLFLFDGFGKAILEKYKKDAPYMYEHVFMEIQSVFPPTTVACTTSVTTGKYPIENAFLGWYQYFKDYDKVAITFYSEIKKEGKKEYIEPPVKETIIKPHFIHEIINEKYGEGSAAYLQNFQICKKFPKSLFPHKIWVKYVDKALETCKFVYAYNIDPDHLMHQYGTNDIRVRNVIRKINKEVEYLTKKHPDVLFIAISDHGMMDVNYVRIESIPGFVETLEKDMVLLEGRFATFFVKDKKAFEKVYKENDILNKNFALVTKEEFMKNQMFGYTENIHPHSMETIGDYFLLATGNVILNDKYSVKVLKGHHAGLTEDEYKINLQIYNK